MPVTQVYIYTRTQGSICLLHTHIYVHVQKALYFHALSVEWFPKMAMLHKAIDM